MGIQGDGGRFDGDTSVLLVLTSVGESTVALQSVYGCEGFLRFDLRFASLCGRDNTSALDEGVGQGRLSVVDMGDNAHVSDLRSSRQLVLLFEVSLGFPLTFAGRSIRARISSTVKLTILTVLVLGLAGEAG